MHGWQDNAGTFDTLIPLLPKQLSYLAIDFPGHGHSSDNPNGIVYTANNYMNIIHYIFKKFRWSKISLMAHSMGSLISFMYASTFPEHIDLVIALDTLKPHTITSYNLENFLSCADVFINSDMRRQLLPVQNYTREEITEKMLSPSYSSVNKETISYLLKRGIKPSETYPDKFIFNLDSRIKLFTFSLMGQDIYMNMANNIRCPYLFLKALDTDYLENKTY